MAFLLFPGKNYGAIWISKSSRAAGLIWKLFLAGGRRGLVPGRHPQLRPPVLSGGMLENRIPGGPRDVCTLPGLGESPGVFFGAGWVEGKGKEDINLGKRSGML